MFKLEIYSCIISINSLYQTYNFFRANLQNTEMHLCHRTTGSSAATERTEATDQEGQVRGSGTEQRREEPQR